MTWKTPKTNCAKKTHASFISSCFFFSFRLLQGQRPQAQSFPNLAFLLLRNMKRRRFELRDYVTDGRLALPLETLKDIGSITVAEAMMGLPLPFPFKRADLLGREQAMFAALCDSHPECSAEAYRYDRYSFKTRLPLETYRGQPLAFVSQEEDYVRMNALTDTYTEPQRLAARLHFQALSPLDQFKSDAVFVRKVLDHLIAAARAPLVTPTELREAIWLQTKECTQFKAKLACDVFRFFKARRVLDMSAGWGDRLLGALAVGVDVYAGFDPNLALKAGHDEILEKFAGETKATIAYEPFEQAALEKQVFFDLAFSSPPFFDFEVYETKSQQQSIQSFPSFEAWFRDFLLVSLEKCWSQLQERGHLVIHMADFGRHKICEPMILWALAALPDCTYHGTIASVGRAEKPRPLFVFQKTRAKNQEWAALKLRQHFSHLL